MIKKSRVTIQIASIVFVLSSVLRFDGKKYLFQNYHIYFYSCGTVFVMFATKTIIPNFSICQSCHRRIDTCVLLSFRFYGSYDILLLYYVGCYALVYIVSIYCKEKGYVFVAIIWFCDNIYSVVSILVIKLLSQLFYISLLIFSISTVLDSPLLALFLQSYPVT